MPLKDILDRALAERYGVAAINIFNDLTLEAVLAAAVEQHSPLIVQTSVKTVRSIGLDVLYGMWETMTAGIEVPVCLHLDHCPERESSLSVCARAGTRCCSTPRGMPVEENLRQMIEVVAQARAVGAHVEGEIEAITGVEDGVGSDEVAKRQSLEVAVDFIQRSGVDVFAPSIGNAHGVYVAEPTLDAQRVTDLVEATGIPIALHGGTGMTDEQFADLIARGCAKVNISTASQSHLHEDQPRLPARRRGGQKWDPPSLFRDVRAAVVEMAAGYMVTFGSAGKAW